MLIANSLTASIAALSQLAVSGMTRPSDIRSNEDQPSANLGEVVENVLPEFAKRGRASSATGRQPLMVDDAASPEVSL